MAELDEAKRRLKEIFDLANKVVNDEDGRDYLFDTMCKIEELAQAPLANPEEG